MSTTHLTVCQRVIRAHRAMRHITIAATRNAVLKLATEAADGRIAPGDVRLRERLHAATGLDIGELAKMAEGWPTNV